MRHFSPLALRIIATVLGVWASHAAAISTDYGTPLEMAYDRNAREVGSAQAYAQTCPVHLMAPEDARQNRETIGQSVGGALLVSDISPWTLDGLRSLKDYGYVVDETDSMQPPARGVTLKTMVTRAYTWHVGIKIFSMVALRAQFIDSNGVLQEKRYRAHGDKTNMWGAESEYPTTLSYGLNNLVPAIARDLQTLCHGKRVDDYTYSGPEEPPRK